MISSAVVPSTAAINLNPLGVDPARLIYRCVAAEISRVLIVLPALNEDASLREVISGAKSACATATLLVVDDGSSDQTGRTAARCGALVATHPINLGVGAAMRTGFAYAEMHGFDAVVQLDADGQHDPRHIPELVEALGSRDVVVGSRFRDGGSYEMHPMRRLAIWLLSRVVSRHCHTRITDATSGFRGAGPRAIRLFRVHYPTEYLGDTVESLVLAGKVGLDVGEIPIRMHPRRTGRASQNPFLASLHLARATFVAVQSFIRGVPRGAKELIGQRP